MRLLSVNEAERAGYIGGMASVCGAERTDPIGAQRHERLASLYRGRHCQIASNSVPRGIGRRRS